MIEYFESVEELNYLMDKKSSLQFYKEYLHPVGQYLAEARGFRSKSDILKYIVVGIVVDFAICYSSGLKLIIITPIMILIGYIRLKKKKE